MIRLALVALLLAGCADAPPVPVAPTAVVTPAPAPVVAFNSATACGAPVLGRDDARTARCEAVHRGIGGEFTADVARAQAVLDATRPDLFRRDQVIDEADYTDAVVVLLGRAGLCAMREHGDSLLVKANQRFSEQYDVVLADFTPRRVGNLTEKCSPASW